MHESCFISKKFMIKFDLGFWNLNNRFDQGFQFLLLKNSFGSIKITHTFD